MPYRVRSKGFTLIELLLVVALIAILSSFLIPGFSNYIDTQNIRQSQELLKSDLRTAQNKAITGVGSSDPTVNYWGIKFPSPETVNYWVFSSTTNDTAACDGVTAANSETSENLPGGVGVANAPASGSCVFFSLRNGDANAVYNGGLEVITLGYSGEVACDGVEFNKAGMIKGVIVPC